MYDGRSDLGMSECTKEGVSSVDTLTLVKSQTDSSCTSLCQVHDLGTSEFTIVTGETTLSYISFTIKTYHRTLQGRYFTSRITKIQTFIKERNPMTVIILKVSPCPTSSSEVPRTSSVRDCILE